MHAPAVACPHPTACAPGLGGGLAAPYVARAMLWGPGCCPGSLPGHKGCALVAAAPQQVAGPRGACGAMSAPAEETSFRAARWVQGEEHTCRRS
eukprot:1156580-Pelagomonas_calceolata.AAC.12